MTVANLQENVFSPGKMSLTKSKNVSRLTVIQETVRKDLTMKFRYKGNLISELISISIFMLVFWFFSTTFEFDEIRDTSKTGVFTFYLAAFLVMSYSSIALYTPYLTVQRDLTNGTLESLYASPASRISYYLGTIIADTIFMSIVNVPLILGVVIVAQMSLETIGMMFLVLAATIGVLMFFGVMIGLTSLLWKQSNTLVNVLGNLTTFLSGAIFPVKAFPLWVQYTSYVLPFTWGFDLARYYAFNGNWDPLYPIWMEWLILAASLVFYFVVALTLLKIVEKKTKNQGLNIL